jgi:23S rRNA pseudouridine1911/1915/1917 synthase
MLQVQTMGEWLVAKINAHWAGKSVETCLVQGFQIPEKKLRHLFQTRSIAVDSLVLRTQDRELPLKAGSVLRVHILQTEKYGVNPEYHPGVEVIWEDEHCLVVNKPAAMLVHPDEPGRSGTLDAAVAYHLLTEGIETKVRHVQRLDRDTSGLVLYAKHAESHRILDQQLAQKQVMRWYLALVHGEVRERHGTIAQPIGRDRHNRKRRVITASGAQAVTHFERIATWQDPQVGNLSLLRLQLETGRTHQIRVHLQHIGHPIVGDVLYGGKQVQGLPPERHALHAFRLGFAHPYTREWIENEAGLPEDLIPLIPSVENLTVYRMGDLC